MRKFFFIPNKFINDKIIVSDDEVYDIISDFDTLANTDSSIVFSYVLCDDLIDGKGYQKFILYADSSIEIMEDNYDIKSIIRKNRQLMESVSINFDSKRLERNIENACKANSVLIKASRLADSIKDQLPKLTPSNEYELLHLVISKNPSIGQVISIEDPEKYSVYQDLDNFNRIRNEMLSEEISEKDWKYIFHTSNGYTLRKINGTFEIKDLLHYPENTFF